MSFQRPTWVISGPGSGVGYRTALELAVYGTVVLVSRIADKLAAVRRRIEDVRSRRDGDGRLCRCPERSSRSLGEHRTRPPDPGVLNNAGSCCPNPPRAGKDGACVRDEPS